jgi:hypothetical protein
MTSALFEQMAALSCNYDLVQTFWHLFCVRNRDNSGLKVMHTVVQRPSTAFAS